jgi:hypothetical protein
MRCRHDDARAEAARRWRGLPLERRQTFEDAEAYAHELTHDLLFATITDRIKLITAWLVLELSQEFRQAEIRSKLERQLKDEARAADFAQWQANDRAAAEAASGANELARAA